MVFLRLADQHYDSQQAQRLTLFLLCRYEFPAQKDLFALDDTFLLGPALLVAPVLGEGAQERNVTLPADAQWFDAFTGALVTSGGRTPYKFNVPVTMESVPSYLRGGQIVPTRERARRSSAAAALVNSEHSDVCPLAQQDPLCGAQKTTLVYHLMYSPSSAVVMQVAHLARK